MSSMSSSSVVLDELCRCGEPGMLIGCVAARDGPGSSAEGGSAGGGSAAGATGGGSSSGPRRGRPASAARAFASASSSGGPASSAATSCSGDSCRWSQLMWFCMRIAQATSPVGERTCTSAQCAHQQGHAPAAASSPTRDQPLSSPSCGPHARHAACPPACSPSPRLAPPLTTSFEIFSKRCVKLASASASGSPPRALSPEFCLQAAADAENELTIICFPQIDPQ